MADVKIVLTIDDKGAVKTVQDFDKAINDMGKTASTKATPALGALWKQFALGNIAADALRGGFRLLKDQIGDSIKAAMEAEKADKALAASLEITGRGAANIAGDFQAYAAQLQRTTIYDDEAIKGAQTLLLQLTNLDKDGINRATRGAIGLASVLGMDLSSAAQLVAKAMTGNTAALSRYGIKVDENLSQEEKRIALMDQLEKMFGRATAETETFSGKLSVLKNRWGEVQEAAGRYVTEQKGITILLDKASQAILDYLTKGEMLAAATQNQVEKENQLAERLGHSAAAAGWKYGEMAKLIAAHNGNFAALLRDINQEKYGTEIKKAYIEELRKEKAEWELIEAARKKAESGANSLTDAAVKQSDTYAGLIGRLLQYRAVLDSIGRYRGGLLSPIPIRVRVLPQVIGTGGGLLNDPGLRDVINDQMAWVMGQTEETALGMTDVWSTAMEAMTAGLVSFGDANASVWENVGAVFSNFAKQGIATMEAMWIRQILISKGIIKAKQGEATASHISNIFKAVPFPLDLILAAGAFAVVNALFAKFMKFGRGGYFERPTFIPNAIVGEAGPEYILPEAKLTKVVKDAIGGGRRGGDGTLAGGLGVSYAITIKGPVISTTAALSREMVRDSAKMLFEEMENQARLRGRRLM